MISSDGYSVNLKWNQGLYFIFSSNEVQVQQPPLIIFYSSLGSFHFNIYLYVQNVATHDVIIAVLVITLKSIVDVILKKYFDIDVV